MGPDVVGVKQESASGRRALRRDDGPTDRVIDILQCLTHDTPRLTAAEISAATSVPRSTTYRLLARLEQRGLLKRDVRTGRYFPGLQLLKLGAVASAQMELREIAHPIVMELLRQTGETVNLSVYHDGYRVCVEKADSIHDIRGVIHVGKPYPLHAGAAGKAILAFLPRDAADRVFREQKLPRFTARTQTRRGPLQASLAEIRRDGVAATVGERVDGATAVSAPIFDDHGAVVASLTVSGPSFRFTPERIKEYRDLVKAAANRLTRAAGGHVPVAGERVTAGSS